MTMQRLENELRGTHDPRDLERADIVASMLKARGEDIPLPSVVTPASNEALAVEKPTARTFSKDQLILPETSLPKEVSEVLERAKKVGIGVFEAYHLSDITLDQNSNVEGWDKKPEDWYWKQIGDGNVSQDAPKLPGFWVLIDKTQKPGYKNGRQVYENDPFGDLLKQLRKDKKVQTVKGFSDTSRFSISHDELTQVVLPEIAKLLGVESSAVRLPKAIEFNIIGNLKHPEWGDTNTWEWFNDKFGDGRRLIGGRSVLGGLTDVYYDWSDRRRDRLGFRPLVVIPSKKP